MSEEQVDAVQAAIERGEVVPREQYNAVDRARFVHEGERYKLEQRIERAVGELERTARSPQRPWHHWLTEVGRVIFILSGGTQEAGQERMAERKEDGMSERKQSGAVQAALMAEGYQAMAERDHALAEADMAANYETLPLPPEGTQEVTTQVDPVRAAIEREEVVSREEHEGLRNRLTARCTELEGRIRALVTLYEGTQGVTHSGESVPPALGRTGEWRAPWRRTTRRRRTTARPSQRTGRER